MHFHSFECDHLNYRPFTPHTHLYSWTYIEQLSCKTQPIELFLFTKVYFQGGMSEAEYRTMFALWALAKVLLHPLAPIVSICLTPPPLISNCQPLLLKCDVWCDEMFASLSTAKLSELPQEVRCTFTSCQKDILHIAFIREMQFG